MISLMLNEPFQEYELFVDGRLYNHNSQRWCKSHLNSSGYKRYAICKNKVKKRFFVHRLVAEYFICDHHNITDCCVDHIDGNRLNNDISNLRWVSKLQNNINRNHPKKNKLIPHLNIYKKPSGNYEIRVKRYKVLYFKTEKTLDDAIKQRDLMKSMWFIP